MREGDGLVLNNDNYQSHSLSISGRSSTTNGTATHIKLVYWNAQGAITNITPIWLHNKPPLLNNIYRVNGALDIKTPLTREPSSIMVGDFNARYEMRCVYSMYIFRILTTINKTAIDLSLLRLTWFR